MTSTEDPRWARDLRWKVQSALNAVTFEAKDILTRHAQQGQYVAPNEISELGDITGLIAAGETQVLDRLEAKIREARSAIGAVKDEISDYTARRISSNEAD
jgi:hypothetical protein